MPNVRSEPPFSMWQFAWQLGYTLAIPLVGGVLLGHWLDGRLDTSPWLLVAGLLIGIALSSLAVVRQLNQVMRKINTVSKSNQSEGDHLRQGENPLRPSGTSPLSGGGNPP